MAKDLAPSAFRASASTRRLEVAGESLYERHYAAGCAHPVVVAERLSDSDSDRSLGRAERGVQLPGDRLAAGLECERRGGNVPVSPCKQSFGRGSWR